MSSLLLQAIMCCFLYIHTTMLPPQLHSLPARIILIQDEMMLIILTDFTDSPVSGFFIYKCDTSIYRYHTPRKRSLMLEQLSGFPQICAQTQPPTLLPYTTVCCFALCISVEGNSCLDHYPLFVHIQIFLFYHSCLAYRIKRNALHNLESNALAQFSHASYSRIFQALLHGNC